MSFVSWHMDRMYSTYMMYLQVCTVHTVVCSLSGKSIHWNSTPSPPKLHRVKPQAWLSALPTCPNRHGHGVTEMKTVTVDSEPSPDDSHKHRHPQRRPPGGQGPREEIDTCYPLDPMMLSVTFHGPASYRRSTRLPESPLQTSPLPLADRLNAVEASTPLWLLEELKMLPCQLPGFGF